jgi:glycosyltransferase involved in cell wall biosynthesis
VILFTSARQPLPLLPWLGRTPSFVIEYTNVPATAGNRWLYGRLARACTGFVAVSDFMREHLVRVGAPRDRTHVIKSGAFRAADAATIPVTDVHLSTSALRIGIVGQIAPHKGHDILVEAARLLRARGVEPRIAVFGDGDRDYVDRLRQMAQEAGLDDVWRWNGYERDTAAVYRQVDVCVVPSRFGDPFPTVAMEAAAFARPVVAARIGGLPEIVEHHATGLLCEPDDPSSLADALDWLARHPADGRAMGLEGRRRVFERLTVEAMADGFEELFQTSLGLRPQGPRPRAVAGISD